MSNLTTPNLFEPAIIGWIKGRPIREIGGGAPDGDGGSGDGGAGDGGLGDLLGDLGGDGDTGAGEGGTGDGTGDGGDNQPPAWWAAAQQQITQQTSAEIDRRINQLVQRGRQQQGSGNGGQQQGGGQQQQGQTAAGPDRMDLQYARTVFRDTVADSIRLSPEERAFVNTLAPGVIRASFDKSPDPDSAGSDAAQLVVEQLKKLRTAHQGAIISRLERAGALDRSKLTQGDGPGQQQGTGGQPSATAAMAAGAEKARQMAERNGRTVPGQKTT